MVEHPLPKLKFQSLFRSVSGVPQVTVKHLVKRRYKRKQGAEKEEEERTPPYLSTLFPHS